MFSKTITFSVIFFFLLKGISAQVCSDPLNTIYGLSQTGGIIPINVNTTAAGTSLTNSSDANYPGSTNNSNAIGLNIQNGMFYYFQDNADNTQQFVSFDPTTNTYTLLANSSISGGVVKGCITADGTGYYCIDGSGALLYYNIASNTWSTIGSNLRDQFGNNLSSVFTSLGSGDIAIDGAGNLWIIVSDASQWGLYELKAPLPITSTNPIDLTEVITPTQSTPGGVQFAGIAYNATGQIFLSTSNDLYLLNSDLTITHEGTFSVPGVGADLTSCNYPINILPVSWQRFTASIQQNNSVLLTWSLNQQLNNKGYTIEHSRDGKHWDYVGYQNNNHVVASTGYSFTHSSPNAGLNYYRIQEVDIDGNVSYSEIKKVNISINNDVSIWPIPAKDMLHITIPEYANSKGISVQIFNSKGQRAIDNLLYGGSNIINVRSLSAGTYVVHIILVNGKYINQKLVKL